MRDSDATGTAGNQAALALFSLSDDTSNKKHMLGGEYKLLPLLTQIFRARRDAEVELACFGVLWFLSRDLVGKYKIVEEPGLVKEVLRVVGDGNAATEMRLRAIKTLVNAVLVSENHATLFAPDLNFVNVAANVLRAMPEEEDPSGDDVRGWLVKLLEHLTGSVRRPEHVQVLLECGVHTIVVGIMRSRPDTKYFEGNTFRTDAFFALKCVVSLSHHPEAARLLSEMRLNSIVEPFLGKVGQASLYAVIILASLYGKDEASLLQRKPDIITAISDCLSAVFDERDGRFSGNLHLPRILSALKYLATSDTNKVLLLQSDIHPKVARVLEDFANDRPEHMQPATAGQPVPVGGGGNDVESASLAIEFLMQLSFSFPADDELRAFFQGKGMTDMPKILGDVLRRPPDRPQLTPASEQLATALYRRLVGSPAPAPAASPHAAKGHVMLSYSWEVKKELVVALGRSLRQQGLDVWRDEEGSSLVPPMSGDVNARMAEAIESSHAVIVCVSPSYKESANCRIEANYSQQKKKRLLFVMMTDGYEREVGGWLGLLLGRDLWYPLRTHGDVPGTALALASLLTGDASPASAPVPAHHHGHSPAPVLSHAHASSAHDHGPAWELLRSPDKAKDPDGLAACLDELGLSEAEDLAFIEEEHLRKLAQFLKPAPANKFLAKCVIDKHK